MSNAWYEREVCDVISSRMYGREIGVPMTYNTVSWYTFTYVEMTHWFVTEHIITDHITHGLWSVTNQFVTDHMWKWPILFRYWSYVKMLHMGMSHDTRMNGPFIRVSWLIPMCNIHVCLWMGHSFVYHDSFPCETWLIHVCDMTHVSVCHDSHDRGSWCHEFITDHMWKWPIYLYMMTHSCVRQDWCICVPWLTWSGEFMSWVRFWLGFRL